MRDANPSRTINGNPLVYVIDDDVDIRRSLHFLLATAGFTSWPFASAFDFLENLPNLQPAPILLDVQMPEIDGIDLMTELANRGIKWPVIAISGHADIRIAVHAIKLGAIDLLEKPLDFKLLESCLAMAIDKLCSVKIASELHDNACCLFRSLSSRESEILLLLASGLANKVAAHRLSLSVRTIEMHRANALQKLQVRSIAEVALLAHNAGIQL